MEQQAGVAHAVGTYERPRVRVHGSVVEVTAASILGINFDQTIPAGTSIVGIIGRLSL